MRQHAAARCVPSPFADARFAPPLEKVGADDLFTLSPAMRSCLDSPAFTRQLRQTSQRQGLVNALYSKTDLKLEYESSPPRRRPSPTAPATACRW